MERVRTECIIVYPNNRDQAINIFQIYKDKKRTLKCRLLRRFARLIPLVWRIEFKVCLEKLQQNVEGRYERRFVTRKFRSSLGYLGRNSNLDYAMTQAFLDILDLYGSSINRGWTITEVRYFDVISKPVHD